MARIAYNCYHSQLMLFIRKEHENTLRYLYAEL